MAEAHVGQELLGAVAVPDVNLLGRELVGISAAADEPDQLLGEPTAKNTS